MRNRNGLTLIEIIIAMALLGIVSLGMLSAMATNFTMVAHSKQMTTDVFAAQQTMEELIQGPPDLATAQTLTVTFQNGLGTQYERQVTGYPLDIVIANGRRLYTFDAEIQMPEPAVPVAEAVTLTMRNDASAVDHVYAVDTRSNLVGNHTIRPATIPDWLYTQHRWYVSKNTAVKAFNPIIPAGTIPEGDWGVKYPRFPEDYELIPGATTAQLDDLTPYKGRHVVYAVRPVAKTGRIGAEVHSSPAWVIGLPVISGLRVHLDASLIADADGTPVQSWRDLTDTLPSGVSNNAVQATAGNRPTLREVRFGKALQFDGINDLLSIANQTTIDLDNLTVIAVAKSDRSYGWFTPIVAKHHTSNAWGIGWTADQGAAPQKKLGFFIRSNAGWPPRELTDLRQASLDEGLNDDWHILRGTASSSEVGFWIDKVLKEQAPRTVGSNISSSNAISIGAISGAYGRMDLAELILYDGTLSDAQLALVEDYLLEKYTAVPVNVISSDASLRSLALDGAAVPGFDPSVTVYEVALPAGTTVAPTLTASANSLNASLQITQAALVNGVGTARVTVRAQNGISSRIYVVNFHEASSDASLSSLSVSGYALTPAFQKDITAYTVRLNRLAASAPSVTATASSNRASLSVTQAGSTVGTASVSVTAEDGTVRVYTVAFEQEVVGLSNLTTNRGTLNPAFDSDTLAYTITYGTNNTFRIRPYSTAGTITLNGTPIGSGSQSAAFSKGTRLTIVVSEPGKISKTYTIN